jgi:hypothetical protein
MNSRQQIKFSECLYLVEYVWHQGYGKFHVIPLCSKQTEDHGPGLVPPKSHQVF